MSFFFVIFIIMCLSTVAYASYSLAPWVPTRKKDLPRILSLANLKAEEIFYDLGCGDGKVIFYINKNSQAKVIGLELALPFYLLCKLRKLLSKNNNLTFKLKNLFNENLSQADAIYIFAGSADKLKNRLKQKLEKELKPGTRVISYAFPMHGWQPTTCNKPSKNDVTIYLYKI